MSLTRFSIASQCIADDGELYRHIEAALTRDLPVVPQYGEHTNVAIMVGSGWSLPGQVERIKEERAKLGRYIVALKDAHDWLIERGIIPDYAVAIDPQESRATCFTNPQQGVKYLIASQCHPAMFDHLKASDVQLWHCYIRKNQQIPPPGTPLISGGTTTGLRAITLFYSMGFREFDLFGYDSCVKDGVLRMTGAAPREGDNQLHDIFVSGRKFVCNPSMTMQATEFQNLYWSMPDIQLRSYGDGIITAILDARAQQPMRTVSFIHGGGPSFASYRYRAEMPARELGALINDLNGDVLIFSKPEPSLVNRVKQALGQKRLVIVDFCDPHFDRPYYRDLLRLADVVTCATDELAKIIRPYGREPIVVPEAYEYPEAVPHCEGNRLLWFGHPCNGDSINRITQYGARYPLTLVTKASTISKPGPIRVKEWSKETMLEEFANADIVLMPATAAYKSPNRTIEAIRQGCFVVAEPHPSLKHIPGIWIGDINEGIVWALQHQSEANQGTALAQQYVRSAHDPRTVAYAWSRVIQACPSTWEAEAAAGLDGSTSTATMSELTCTAT